MTLANKLADHDFVNWVKAGLVLQFTKEGIEDLVSTVTTQFHKTILTSLPGGIACTACSTENVLPCPTNGICGGRGCRYHSIIKPSNCTSCEHIRNQVFNKHRYRDNNAPLRFGGPSWRNTDATQWSTNPWELVKCYMARDGYSHVTSVKDTDLPGLLSVIINHIDFQTVLAENLNSKPNIFFQARQIRNDILHSPTQRVTDADLKMYINTMVTMLSDPVKLVHDTKAKGAIAELKKVTNGSLFITDQDKDKVLSEAQKALNELKRDALGDFRNEAKTETDEKLQQIQAKTETSKDQIETKIREGKKTLQVTTESLKDQIESKTQEGKTALQVTTESSKNQIETKTQEGKTTLQATTESSKDQIESKTQEGMTALQVTTKSSKYQIEAKTQEGKTTLQVTTEAFENQIEVKTNDGKKRIQEKTESSENQIEAKTQEGKTTLQVTTEAFENQIEVKTNDGKKIIQENTEASQNQIEAKTQEGKTTLQVTTESSKDQIETKTKEGKRKLLKTTKTLKDQIEAKSKKAKRRLQEDTKTSKSQIRVQTKKSKRKLQEAIKTSKDQIGVKIKKAKQTLQQNTDASKDQIEAKTEESKRELQEETDIAKMFIQQASCFGSERKIQYEKMKSALKKKLIEIYKARHLTTPLIPSNTEVDVKIAETYVQPHMEIELLKKRSTNKTKVFNKIDNNKDEESDKKQTIIIKSYQDIFQKDPEDEDLCENVYFTGDAGSGKTSFCKNMVSTWCNVHHQNENLENKSEQENEKVQNTHKMFEILEREMYIPSSRVQNMTKQNITSMAKFDFLFYISLRDCLSEGDVVEMIESMLPKKYHDIISEVLDDEEEQCLIILDGLDEWTKPKQYKSNTSVTKSLPTREVWSKCSILTTTRPWKLAHLGLKSSEIDRQINILGIDYNSSEMLISNIVELLNKEYDKTKSTDDFETLLNEKDMEEMRYVPVLLKQMICLWHDGKSIGESQCEIYSGMLELLFEMADVYCYTEMQAKTTLPKQLPACFYKTRKCKQIYGLICSVSKLAFFTTFSNDQRSSLVFEKSVASYHGMSQTEMDICLKAGLLSQSRHSVMCTEQNVKVSFLHKTFQEFLAALYIAFLNESHEDPVDNIMHTCDSVYKILEMSKVFVFVAGISPTIASRISEHIGIIASADEEIQKYREDGWVSYSLKQNTQDTSIKLLQELFLNCFIEGEKNGHTGMTIQLQDMTADDEDTRTKIDKYTKSIYNLKSLKYTNQFGAAKHNPFELTQNSTSSLTVMHFEGIRMTSLTTEHFSNTLHSLSCLLSIKFEEVTMANGQYLCLLNFLSQQTQMKHIRLLKCHIDLKLNGISDDDSTSNSNYDSTRDIGYSDDSSNNIGQQNCQGLSQQTEIQTDGDCNSCAETDSVRRRYSRYGRKVYTLDLSHHSHLRTLCLIDDSSIHTCTPRVNTKNLKNYERDCNRSLDSIKGASKLKRLSLARNFTPQTVIQTLPTLTNLQQICISNIDFDTEQLRLSRDMKNVTEVQLVMVRMTRKSVCDFIDSIPDTPHPVSVMLGYMTILPAENQPQPSSLLRSYALNHRLSNTDARRVSQYLLFETINTPMPDLSYWFNSMIHNPTEAKLVTDYIRHSSRFKFKYDIIESDYNARLTVCFNTKCLP